MIFLKTQEEIELLRESNQLVGKTLGEVAKHIRPGISIRSLRILFVRMVAFPDFSGMEGSQTRFVFQ